MNKIFDEYLEDLREEYTGDNIIELSSLDDVVEFERQYEDDIVQFFKDNEYSYTDSGKLRALKDYLRQNDLTLDFNDGITFDDVLEEFEWGNTSSDNEILIDKIEKLIESMQEFIEEYRDHDAYMPNMNKVLKNWINELQNMTITEDFDNEF